MTQTNPWQLPEGVEDILPEQARAIELTRGTVLDAYKLWGYELVQPPLIEFLESLHSVAGDDLQLQTFKITDQLSGRQMGVRADITPQVARIDAHSLKRTGVSRLCYTSPVLHTKPSGLYASRIPYQTGVELFGDSGPVSDIEVISLLLTTLQQLAIGHVTLDLGHVGVYRALVKAAGLSAQKEAELADIYQRKSLPDLEYWLEQLDLPADINKLLVSLPQLAGDITVLDSARSFFAEYADIIAAIDNVATIATAIGAYFPAVKLYFDLSELRSYQYHTGCVFAAYHPNHGSAIAKGGRYDSMGEAADQSRPATGFSADLKVLVSLSEQILSKRSAIFSPLCDIAQSPSLLAKVAELRQQGKIVVQALSAEDRAEAQACESELQRINGKWQVCQLN